MSENVKEVIKIDDVKEGKYGPYAKVGSVYYNKGKFFKGSFDDMKAGNTYEVEVYTTGTGGKYIQKMVAMVSNGAKAAPEKTEETPAKAEDKPVRKTYTPKAAVSTGRNFDAEARGKTRCALMEAALQSPALPAFASSLDEYKKLLVEAADYAYTYVFPGETNA